MRIFFSFQKVWSLYYCMSLSRSRIMRSFFTSVQTKMPTSIFARDRIQLYLANMAIFHKMTKWPYLSPEVPNPKNKGTLFSSTFKVGEKKVPSDFYFKVLWLRYSHLFYFAYYSIRTRKNRKLQLSSRNVTDFLALLT